MEKLLKKLEGALEPYDMKNEFSGFGKMKGGDALELLQEYKAYNDGVSIAEKIDCCNSLLAMNVYEKAYWFLEGYRRKKLESNRPNYYQCNYIYGLYQEEAEYMGVLLNSYDVSSLCETTQMKGKELSEDDISLRAELEKYVTYYHSIGNMIPVPSRIWSFNNNSFVSWNDVLNKIYRAFVDSEDNINPAKEPLAEIWNHIVDNEILEDCMKWLSNFVNEEGYISFSTFVKSNFLEMYCDEREGEYIPTNTTLCKLGLTELISGERLTKTELLKLLKKLNELIKDRNDKIVEFLRKNKKNRLGYD